MPSDVISHRYAGALFGAIAEPALLDSVCEELMALAGLVDDNPRLEAFLEGPTVELADKHALVTKTFQGRIEQRTLDFLHLLIDKRRIDHLRPIAAEFQRMVEARRNQLRVKVTTAVAMTVDMADRLKRALDASLGKDCILEKRIDPNIVGGVVCVLGDRVIDGSLRTALEDMRRHLLSTPL